MEKIKCHNKTIWERIAEKFFVVDRQVYDVDRHLHILGLY